MQRALWVLAGLVAFSGCGEDAGLGESARPSTQLEAPERPRFGRTLPAPVPTREPRGRPAWIAASASDPIVYGQASPVFDGSAARERSAAVPVTLPDAGAALTGAAVVKRAGMAIDTDGPVAGYDRRVHRDPHRQLQTSLRYSDGSSLDPTRVPYIVVPCSEKALLGDLAVVEYRGRRTAAVVGDCGRKWGEGSVALADTLGIPSDGVTGGISSGVTYTVYRGSGKRRPTRAELSASLSSAQASLTQPTALASL